MPMLDTFNNDAFNMRSLTDSINRLKFIPGRIGQMGLFMERGWTTTKIAMEIRDGIVVLIPPTPRGGPGTTVAKQRREMIAISCPHFEVNDAIYADEIQGVRAWGSESDVETMQDWVANRDEIILTSFAATQEYSRIGALKGIITYADGTSTNLYTLFANVGVTQHAEVDLNLDATVDDGSLRKACAGITRDIADALGGLPFSYVHCFASNELFDALISNLEVRNTYKNTPMAQVLRDGYITPYGKIYGAFEFGGIVWENYRGKIGAQGFIAANKGHCFPMGVPGLFKTAYAPADLDGAVNTVGQRLYQWQYLMQNGKGRHLDTQMNALEYCTRPEALIQVKTT